MVDKIKALARQRGMTISEVERKAGISHGAIGKWEKSKPLAENLQKVASVLGVKFEELLGQEGGSA